jgi:hypothetical protein
MVNARGAEYSAPGPAAATTPNYPFSPSVTVDTNCVWKVANTTITGIAVSTEPAMIPP